MKTRFNTVDIVRGVAELQTLVGLRLNQVYDINNKTFLFRLQGGNEEGKKIILIESGIRFHTTAFEWPKNAAPNGFTMKLRKHLKNKRLESFQQLGSDRIVNMQFGTNEVAFHVILELYDRGNIILADHELTILYILRPHTHGEQVKYGLKEKYPMGHARLLKELTIEADVRQWLLSIGERQDLRGALMQKLDCGSTLVEHVLIENGLQNRCIMPSADISNATPPAAELEVRPSGGGKQRRKKNDDKLVPLDLESDVPMVFRAIQMVNDHLRRARSITTAGYIIQKAESGPAGAETFFQNIEYQPYLYAQYKNEPHVEFENFMAAVDEFYSKQESQKLDLKTFQQERDAMKKLSNIRNDHTQRLTKLNEAQEVDKRKAEVIISNQELVSQCILAIQTLIASQVPWPVIDLQVKKAQQSADPVAGCIKALKLETNKIVLQLEDPYASDDSLEDVHNAGITVDIDLSLSAWANARRYYDEKRSAANKEQKTIDASQKALKSAERKAKKTLKEVRAISSIVKARKVYWFEKFYWFISSENYLVIGGRDAQQNELIVKRYMRPSDVYMHAEIQGASSVVICNPQGGEVSPKTLLEAGTMAISYSVAWDAKILTNCYWVHGKQVSKTAPSGEYLSTGSFLIRGKKNFLPPCNFVMGLGIMFKLEESFVAKHLHERREKAAEDEISSKKDDCLAEKELEAMHSLESLNLGEVQPRQPVSATEFPNIEIKIYHFASANAGALPAVSAGQDALAALVNQADKAVDEGVIIETKSTRVKQVNAKKQKKAKLAAELAELAKPPQQNDNESGVLPQVTRGKQSKLKKIKSKYRDQDEEERQLRMQILSSAGKDLPPQASDSATPTTAKPDETEKSTTEAKPHPNAKAKTVDAEGEEEEEEDPNRDIDIIDELTGQPFEDDEVLFAVPVVAPYQALQQYKYKIKLIPGTGKRGKAAKTALNYFQKDKCSTAHEKNLIKSIKDEVVARNIPGKVKLSGEVLKSGA